MFCIKISRVTTTAAVLLYTIFMLVVLCQATTDIKHKTSIFKCSVSEIESLQRRWNWLTRETTNSQKIALYDAVHDYMYKRMPDVTKALYDEYEELLKVPLVARAYRMFTDYGLLINMYTSPGVIDSQVEHLILTMPESMANLLAQTKLMTESVISVIGGLIDVPEEKITWENCLVNMFENVVRVYESFHFRAHCDVTSADGKLSGKVNFTQPASGGVATMSVELSVESASTDSQPVIDIVQTDQTMEQCNDDTQQTTDRSRRLCRVEVHRGGRVSSMLTADTTTLFGPNNIIGKTLAISLSADGSTTLKQRLACCTVQQTYD